METRNADAAETESTRDPWINPYREYDLDETGSCDSASPESDASWADGGDMLETNAPTETATNWTDACALEDLSVGAGTCAMVGNRQVAVFRISEIEVRAVQNICPHKAAAVIHQGVLADREGDPVVLCPLHKRAYSLDTGNGLDEDGGGLKTFQARIREGRIEVAH